MTWKTKSLFLSVGAPGPEGAEVTMELLQQVLRETKPELVTCKPPIKRVTNLRIEGDALWADLELEGSGPPRCQPAAADLF